MFHRYQSRMDIWRYKGPNDCDLVYSITTRNPLGISWGTRGNFLRDVYCGCVVLTTADTLTAYISNWETGKHVIFDTKMVKYCIPSKVCPFPYEIQ